MRTDLLLRLANLLERNAANPQGMRFDLNGWAKPSTARWSTYDARHFPEDIKSVPVSCDTTGCAMGLAAISGEFFNEGLFWELKDTRLLPVMKGKETGYAAAAKLFKLNMNKSYGSHDEYTIAEVLFDQACYSIKTGAEAELEVASRIRLLCANSDFEYDSEYKTVS